MILYSKKKKKKPNLNVSSFNIVFNNKTIQTLTFNPLMCFPRKVICIYLNIYDKVYSRNSAV